MLDLAPKAYALKVPLPLLHDHLLLWLRRHGQHVRRLSLRVSALDTDYAVVEQAVQFMAAAADAVPQLEQLLIEWTSTLYRSEWLGQLPASSLQELSFGASNWEQGLELCSAINGLTQLTKLVLMARHLQVHEDVQLPPSLRTLAVNGEDAEHPLLQHQASTLGVPTGVVVSTPCQHHRSARQACMLTLAPRVCVASQGADLLRHLCAMRRCSVVHQGRMPQPARVTSHASALAAAAPSCACSRQPGDAPCLCRRRAVQLPTLTRLDKLVVGYRAALPEEADVGTALTQLTVLESQRLALPEWTANLAGLKHLVRAGGVQDEVQGWLQGWGCYAVTCCLCKQSAGRVQAALHGHS